MDMSMPPTDTQVPRIIASNTSAYCLAVIAVLLRFCARRVMRAKLWWDDWLILPPIVLITVVFFTSVTWLCSNGFGRHVDVAGLAGVTVFGQELFLSEICYTIAITCTKFSILAFCWRLFAVSGIHLPIYILSAVTSAWGIACLFVNIFQCKPVSGFWDHTIGAHCGVNTVAFFYGQSIPNILTDVLILGLPVFFIHGLHISKWKKALTIGIFMTGGLVIAISITRFVYLTQLNLESPDVTWNFVNVQIWTTLEMDMAVISACLPSLKPLAAYALPGLMGSSQGHSSTPSYGSRKMKGPRAWVSSGAAPTKHSRSSPPLSDNSDLLNSHGCEEQTWSVSRGRQDDGGEEGEMELRDVRPTGGIMGQKDIDVRHV